MSNDDVERWTIRVCPDSTTGKESLCYRNCGLSRKVEVVEASELERVEAERDALADSLKPLVFFCEKVMDLSDQMSAALRQVVAKAEREILAAQEKNSA